jgi:hypothetical protein
MTALGKLDYLASRAGRELSAATHSPPFERTKAGTFDKEIMDEHVSAAVLGLNESTALCQVEPFDRACSHHGLL